MYRFLQGTVSCISLFNTDSFDISTQVFFFLMIDFNHIVYFQGKQAVKRSRAQIMRKPSDVKSQLEEMIGGKNTAKEMINRNNRKGEKYDFRQNGLDNSSAESIHLTRFPFVETWFSLSFSGCRGECG